jgi:glycosyltransferase involved in cell wall biosynthesis
MSNPYISVISPVYRAEGIVDELVSQITSALETITDSYEIILVEDGGPDNSWDKIEANCRVYPHVKGVKLSRNFGQHYAITAGIDIARGEYLIIMDCDLQDDPKYIPELLSKANQGFDIVYTTKDERKHSSFKNLTAKLYNIVFNYLVGNNKHKSDGNIGAFSLINRKVANAFKEYNDYHRHYLMVLRWLGYNYGYIKIEHKERFTGTSSYTLGKLIKHAIDGITSQSDKLLRIFVGIGLFISSISFLTILLIIIMYFVNGFKSGWASTIVVILFSTGIILTGIGIIGIYLGKTFEQTKNRPKYLIDKVINQNDN